MSSVSLESNYLKKEKTKLEMKENKKHTLKMRDLLEEFQAKPPPKCMVQTKTMTVPAIASR